MVTKLKGFFRNDVTFPRITSQVGLRLITVNAKKFYLPCCMILLRAADMKCAAVSIFVSIAFVSQTFAGLQSRRGTNGHWRCRSHPTARKRKIDRRAGQSRL